MARIDPQTGLLRIDADEAGSRLDRVLIRQLRAGRRSLILRLIRKGNVRVNRKRAKPETRLKQGDEVFLPASLRHAEEHDEPGISEGLMQRAAKLPVLYEDDDLLAIDKPGGMVVHGGSGYAAGLIEALRAARGLPELRLAHRLDRDTSGVLLLARHLQALRALTASFRERDMDKTYFALVAGHPFAHAGRMRSRLSKGVVRGGERMVADSSEGKEALTDYQVVLHGRRQGLDYALVALKPHSGRTHQLRVQLAGEGHPILGDDKYGERQANRDYRALGGKGLALHAWRLRFVHPSTARRIELRSPIPEHWLDWVRL